MEGRNRPPETGADKVLARIMAADRREPPPALVLAPLAMLPGMIARADHDAEILRGISRWELERVSVFDPPTNDCRGAARLNREEATRGACMRALKLANRRFAQLQRVVTATRDECGRGVKS